MYFPSYPDQGKRIERPLKIHINTSQCCEETSAGIKMTFKNVILELLMTCNSSKYYVMVLNIYKDHLFCSFFTNILKLMKNYHLYLFNIVAWTGKSVQELKLSNVFSLLAFSPEAVKTTNNNRSPFPYCALHAFI